jgi:hypothetical protein
MVVRYRDGRIHSSVRKINTTVNAQLLVGDGWPGVAYAELMRLSLVVGAYHSQLEGNVGHEETGRAAEALKAAYIALNAKYGSDDDDDDEGGLELQLQPDR